MFSTQAEEVFMQTKTAYVCVYVWALFLMCFFPVNSYAQALSNDPDSPGQGTLIKEGDVREVIPLKHTDVKMSIVGFVASVDVEQTFVNPSSEKIEATYIFPLPSTSAVDNLEMVIGSRVVKGNIAAREEAETTFKDASSQGKNAALLEQERQNVFTITVANIDPISEITVRIHYTQRLFYEEGTFRINFPMVVMPRYIPGSPVDNSKPNSYGYRVRNTANLNPPRAYEANRVGNISLTVDLMPGMSVKDIQSLSHDVVSSDIGGNRYEIKLAGGAMIPNKDFVLEYKLEGNEPKGTLFQAVDETGQGYFMLMAIPPSNLPTKDAYPKDVMLVIDTSGSMTGKPLEQAKEGLIKCLEMLNPQDTFNIVPFESSFKPFFEDTLPATPENINTAIELVKKLDAGGGTEILAPLVHVLTEHEKTTQARIAEGKRLKRLPVVVVFSDGGIGNEEDVLVQTKKHLSKTRIFTFGMGPSVNEYFMKKLAQVGRGTSEMFPYKGEEGILPYVARFQKRISNPILVDLSIKWPGVEVFDLSPSPMPDLYLNQPIFLTGKFAGSMTGSPVLHAKSAKSSKKSFPLEIDTNISEVKTEILSALWARARLEDFTDMLIEDPNNEHLQQQVLDLALKHNLLSPVTTFVAVDTSSMTSAGLARRVNVPVLVPDGWPAGSMLLKAGLSSTHRTLQAPKHFTAKPSGKTSDKSHHHSDKNKARDNKKHKQINPASLGNKVGNKIGNKVGNLDSSAKVKDSLLPEFPSKSKSNPITAKFDYGFDIKDSKALLDYIVKKQQPTGQWLANTPAATLRNTALALMAMLEDDRTRQEDVYKVELFLASDYLFSNIDGFGRLFEVMGHPQETEIHAQVLHALNLLSLKKPKLVVGREEFLDLLKQRLLSLRSPSGLWYSQENGQKSQESLSATTWAIIALDKQQAIKSAKALDRVNKINNSISIEGLLIKLWAGNKPSPEQTKALQENLNKFNWNAAVTDETLFTLMLLDKIDGKSATTLKEGVTKYSQTPPSSIDMLALRYLIMEFEASK